jgi:hypothetical protein
VQLKLCLGGRNRRTLWKRRSKQFAWPRILRDGLEYLPNVLYLGKGEVPTASRGVERDESRELREPH